MDSSLPFWRMELDELARAAFPCLCWEQTIYITTLLSGVLTWLLFCPSPPWNLYHHACAQGSITQDIKAAHITPTRSPALPSWSFASPHPKARRKLWPSWLIINVTPIFEIINAFKRIFFPQSLTLNSLTLWIPFAWMIFENNCKWPFYFYLNHTFRWKE